MAFARNEQIFEESIHWILADEGVDALVVFLLYHPFMTPGRIAAPIFRQRQLSGKAILLCANSPRGLIDEELSNFESKGVPVYALPDRAIRALKGLIEYGEVVKQNRCAAGSTIISP